jgi:polyhydroxyalkanoate synthesis regulator phasin
MSAIPKLIELKYFNPNHPENHNIKITNIHDKFAKIYKDNKWLVSHKKDVIADLVDNGYADFEEFKDLNESEVTEKIKEKYKKMESHYVNNVDTLYKDSEVAIINGSNKLNNNIEV